MLEGQYFNYNCVQVVGFVEGVVKLYIDLLNFCCYVVVLYLYLDVLDCCGISFFCQCMFNGQFGGNMVMLLYCNLVDVLGSCFVVFIVFVEDVCVLYWYNWLLVYKVNIIYSVLVYWGLDGLELKWMIVVFFWMV